VSNQPPPPGCTETQSGKQPEGLGPSLFDTNGSGAARLLGDGLRRRGAPRLWKRIRSPAATPYRLEQVDQRRVIERR
jgi:hypothetical protein